MNTMSVIVLLVLSLDTFVSAIECPESSSYVTDLRACESTIVVGERATLRSSNKPNSVQCVCDITTNAEITLSVNFYNVLNQFCGTVIETQDLKFQCVDGVSTLSFTRSNRIIITNNGIPEVTWCMMFSQNAIAPAAAFTIECYDTGKTPPELATTSTSPTSYLSTTIPAASTTIPAASTTIPAASSPISAASTTIPEASTKITAASTTILAASITFPAASTTITAAFRTIPSATTTIPSASTTILAASKTIPAASTTIPEASTTIRVASRTIPAASTIIQAASTTLFAASTTIPAATTTIAAASTTIRAASTTIQAASTTIPTASTTIPAAFSTIPAITTIPAATTTIPAPSTKMSAASTTTPAASTTMTAASTTILAAFTTFPAVSKTIIATSTTLHTASTTIPAASTKITAASTTIPAASTTIPAVSTTIPAAFTTIPAASTKVSAASTTIPAVSRTIPAASTTIPAASSPISAASTSISPNSTTRGTIPSELTIFVSEHLTTPAYSSSTENDLSDSKNLHDSSFVYLAVGLCCLLLLVATLISVYCYFKRNRTFKENPSPNPPADLTLDPRRRSYIDAYDPRNKVFEIVTTNELHAHSKDAQVYATMGESNDNIDTHMEAWENGTIKDQESTDYDDALRNISYNSETSQTRTIHYVSHIYTEDDVPYAVVNKSKVPHASHSVSFANMNEEKTNKPLRGILKMKDTYFSDVSTSSDKRYNGKFPGSSNDGSLPNVDSEYVQHMMYPYEAIYV